MRRLVVLFLFSAFSSSAQEVLTLDEALSHAEASDPSLRASRAAVAQAQSELAAALAYPRSEIEIRGGHATANGASKAESELSFRQPLDLFNRRGARRQTAEAQIAIERASAEQVRLVVRALVRAAYFEVMATDRSLAAAREDRDAARQLEQLVNRRAELGETREVDRLRMQIERQRAEDRVEQLEIARTAAERTLRLLLGGALSERFTLVDVSPRLTRSYETLLSQVIAHQPRVQIADAAVRQREALLKLARANRWPGASLGAFRNHEIDKEAGGISVGLSMPLFGWNRGEIAAAAAALERARAERDAVERGVSTEFTAAFHDTEALSRRVDRLNKELLPRARRAFEIAEVAYREGETSQLDYLDARRTYVGLQQELLGVLRDLAAAQSRLEQIAGEPLDAQCHP